MIKNKIIELLKIVEELKVEYEKYNKEFTLDGRLVGDIGEVLCAKKYRIRLFKVSVPLHDGEVEYNGKKVQIKATMKDSFWYPRDDDPELYLAVEITPKGELIEVYNGDPTPIRKYIMEKRTANDSYKYFTITKGVLRRLNTSVDPVSRIESRSI